MINPKSDVWNQRTWYVVLLVGLLRVLYLAVVPLDLVHDEAYYWDWSRHPAWGYYSKPPMVAWLIGLSTTLGGDHAYFVRLPAALLSTLGIVFVASLARRMYGPEAGFWAALLSVCTPGNTVLSLVMTIDAPLLCAWSAALYAFWVLLENRRAWQAYVACGVALGGGFLSKQTMLGFLPLAGLFLLWSRSDRWRCLDWRLWCTALAALACLAPVLLWNAHHGWVTLVHTSEHFSTEPASIVRRMIWCLEFLGTQMGVISPITWLAFVACAWALLRDPRRLERRQAYLMCFSMVPLLPVVLLSLRQRVEANWPAPFYISGMVLLAGCWSESRLSWLTAWRKHAIRCGGAFSLATLLLPFLILGTGLQGTRFDAAVRLWGWQELGTQVASRLEDFSEPHSTLIIAQQKRGVASELAFYLPHQPSVYVFNNSGVVASQYDVWGGPGQAQRGRDALLLAEEEHLAPDLSAAFDEVTPLAPIEVPIGTTGRKHFLHAWRGRTLQHWPDRPVAHATRPTEVQR